MKGQEREPGRLVTDKLRSYQAAHRTVEPSVVHDTEHYANNRAEVSHEPIRQRERQMRGFKSVARVQRFWSVHGVIQNLFRIGRPLPPWKPDQQECARTPQARPDFAVGSTRRKGRQSC
ncbi:MAG TPA: DDE-type integrase/transposase/recombinase [Terriglobia bacterium]|nr:DDE-type integrase/transposase/recombinase [Terriglobia bacterium]